jgi:hypothetical protein
MDSRDSKHQNQIGSSSSSVSVNRVHGEYPAVAECQSLAFSVDAPDSAV